MNALLGILDAAALAAGVTRSVRGEAVDYEVDGVLVASVGPAGAEFRLGPEIVAAALGTPDTAASPRGAGWATFRPRVLDRFAQDRAEAWLGLAARLSRPSSPGH
jgi:hypothetical protein